MDKRNKIKKLKTDIKYLIKKIELWLAKAKAVDENIDWIRMFVDKHENRGRK